MRSILDTGGSSSSQRCDGLEGLLPSANEICGGTRVMAVRAMAKVRISALECTVPQSVVRNFPAGSLASRHCQSERQAHAAIERRDTAGFARGGV
jgi:hypothetical protein